MTQYPTRTTGELVDQDDWEALEARIDEGTRPVQVLTGAGNPDFLDIDLASYDKLRVYVRSRSTGTINHYDLEAGFRDAGVSINVDGIRREVTTAGLAVGTPSNVPWVPVGISPGADATVASWWGFAVIDIDLRAGRPSLMAKGSGIWSTEDFDVKTHETEVHSRELSPATLRLRNGIGSEPFETATIVEVYAVPSE